MLDRLIYFLGLLDSGCPVARHELLDWEWHMIGHLKAERERLRERLIAERSSSRRID